MPFRHISYYPCPQWYQSSRTGSLSALKHTMSPTFCLKKIFALVLSARMNFCTVSVLLAPSLALELCSNNTLSGRSYPHIQENLMYWIQFVCFFRIILFHLSPGITHLPYFPDGVAPANIIHVIKALVVIIICSPLTFAGWLNVSIGEFWNPGPTQLDPRRVQALQALPLRGYLTQPEVEHSVRWTLINERQGMEGNQHKLLSLSPPKQKAPYGLSGKSPE